MTQAMAGLRVLDLTRLLPGAICTLLLADMGADVVKIEDPHGGDYARWMPPLIDGMGAFFRSSNRNKRSVILDLKTTTGQKILHKLVESADVLVEGFRPGVTQRLNCDYDTLRQINPRLVYCSLSGWGQDGPYAYESGHDLNYVSVVGLQGATGTPQPLGGQVADVGGAYIGAMGILAALLKRQQTGQGDWIDVSLAEAAMPFAMYAWVEALMLGTGAGNGMLTGFLACYNVYRSRDGRAVALAALEEKFWANFCAAVDKPQWLPLHLNPSQQMSLKEEVAALFAQKTAHEWQVLLDSADCCFSVINPPADIEKDAHISARGMLGRMADSTPWMRSPVRLRDDHFQVGAVPGYGEHTRAILREAGYSDGDIDEWLASGILKEG